MCVDECFVFLVWLKVCFSRGGSGSIKEKKLEILSV